MLDLVIFVLAEAGEALRIERGPDLARAFVAVERGNRAVEVAVAHQPDVDGGVRAGVGHCDVEMLNAPFDVGHDLRELRLAVGARAVDEHAHRSVIFSDAVDAAGEVIFGTEGGFQKTVGNFGIGEDLALHALACGDGGNFRRRRRRCDRRDRESRNCSEQRQAVNGVHLPATLPHPAAARKAQGQALSS